MSERMRVAATIARRLDMMADGVGALDERSPVEGQSTALLEFTARRRANCKGD